MADPQRFAQCVEAALAEALGAFEILDRDLELPGDQRALFVGVDDGGRLTLVLCVEGEGEGPLLAALDALSFARTHRAPLLRHLACDRVRPEAAPRVVLLADAWSRKLSERLVPLGPEAVAAFAVKRIKSARGESFWLSPAHVPQPSEEAPIELSVEAFLAALPSELQALARLFARKLERMDDEFEVACQRRRLFWRFRGEVLCRLELSGTTLMALVAPDYAARPVRREAEVEALIESVLRHYVALLEGTPDLPPGAERMPVPEAGAARPAESRRSGPAPQRSGPLLSPEELAAFHD